MTWQFEDDWPAYDNDDLIRRISGYHRYFTYLRDFLISELGDKIEVVPLEDPGVTGNFEVTVMDTGDLIHSKRRWGQGKATSTAEKMVIVDQIKEILDDQQ
jgi:predicted Rdx family selenoprotein